MREQSYLATDPGATTLRTTAIKATYNQLRQFWDDPNVLGPELAITVFEKLTVIVLKGELSGTPAVWAKRKREQIRPHIERMAANKKSFGRNT